MSGRHQSQQVAREPYIAAWVLLKLHESIDSTGRFTGSFDVREYAEFAVQEFTARVQQHIDSEFTREDMAIALPINEVISEINRLTSDRGVKIYTDDYSDPALIVEGKKLHIYYLSAEIELDYPKIMPLRQFGDVWLFKTLNNILERQTSSLENHSAQTGEEIPAADRYVRKSDNQAAATELETALEALEEAVRGDNEFAASDPEIRAQTLDEIGSARELLRSREWFSIKALKALIEAPTRRLAAKFNDVAIGELSRAAIKWLITWIF